jgi:hypothetical protein
MFIINRKAEEWKTGGTERAKGRKRSDGRVA